MAPAPGLRTLRCAHRFALSNHPGGEFGYFLLTQKMQIVLTICRSCGLSPFFIKMKMAPAPGLPTLRCAHCFALSNHPGGEFGYFLLTQNMQIVLTICRSCGLSPFFIKMKMAPAPGLEPGTKWLTATYSTIELCRSVRYVI